MSAGRTKYYDQSTLYVVSGVATEDQLYKSLRQAIKTAEENLNKEIIRNFCRNKKIAETDLRFSDPDSSDVPQRVSLDCKIKVNLIVNKNSEYYGFGYIHVSDPRVYWVLLGRNTDGSERIITYPDPNWVAPTLATKTPAEGTGTGVNWYEMAEEADRYIQPMIEENLGPLTIIPGYKYDEEQYAHLQDVAESEGKDPSSVPLMGYFELSRAYARDVDQGKQANVLRAQPVPDWIPAIAFKSIFGFYVRPGSEHPQINLTDIPSTEGTSTSRKVTITFDPNTMDAIFVLLMTRKVHIVHPKRPDLKCTLIFDHDDFKYNSSTSKTNSSKTTRFGSEAPKKSFGSDRFDRSHTKRDGRSSLENNSSRASSSDRRDRNKKNSSYSNNRVESSRTGKPSYQTRDDR